MYRVCTACRIPPVCSQRARARASAHKCASSDRRYALMQTPALLRMPQKRATELPAVRSFNSETPLLPPALFPPTHDMANSRYSPSLSVSLFHSSDRILPAPPLHSPSLRRLCARFLYFFLLTYCILISCFSFFFHLALGLAAYFSPPETATLYETIFQPPPLPRLLSPPSVLFCSCHRSPSSSRMSFGHVDASAAT